MDEIVFDPGVWDELDGKDLRIIISAKDDHSCVVTAAIAMPGNGAVIAVPHSQVLRAGSEINFRIPMAVKVVSEVLEDVIDDVMEDAADEILEEIEKPARKRSYRKKTKKTDKEE